MQIANVSAGPGQPDEPVLERLRADVAVCARPRDVFAHPEQNRRTREWIADRLRALGYHVELQGPYRNVVALPPSRAASLPLVCAHYDSVETTPGADDNASAVAVLLEVARALVARGVGFVAFNAEEHGLAGSADFVTRYLPEAGLGVTVAHVLEMVGYTSTEPGSQGAPIPLPGLPEVGDFVGVVATPFSEAPAEAVLAQARALDVAPAVSVLRLPDGAAEAMPDAFRSDHAPFWRARRPALMWTDTAEFRNPNYHRPSDTPDTLDYGFMARVAALVAASVDGSIPRGLRSGA